MKFSSAETVTMVTIADAFLQPPSPQHPRHLHHRGADTLTIAAAATTAPRSSPPPFFPSFSRRMPNTNGLRAHTRPSELHAVYKSRRSCERDRVCVCVLGVRVWALARMGGAGARPITAPNRGFYYCHRAARPTPFAPPQQRATDSPSPRSVSTRCFVILHYYYYYIPILLYRMWTRISAPGEYIRRTLYIGTYIGHR